MHTNKHECCRDDDCSYENTRRVIYGSGATFIPVCTKCHRYVKHDQQILIGDGGISDEPNATCSNCGRAHMHFEGFV